MDVSGMARSAGAMALGYQRFDPQVKVAGIVANNVASSVHLQIAAEAIEKATSLPVVGCLPQRTDLRLPERHLGLIPTAEGRVEDRFFARLVDQIEQSVDLEATLRLARAAAPVDVAPTGIFPQTHGNPEVSIAIARDEAFCFYYEDNLDLLSAWGARLIPFSPLHDQSLPEGAQGLYLGGGFPELFAQALAENFPMLASIRAAHAAGMPIYAECGGLMYLCRSIDSPEGQRHPMVGLVPARTLMRGGRVELGYRLVRARQDSILLEKGQTARGHEFHWSEVEPVLNGPEAAYEVLEDSHAESAGRSEGYQRGNLLASYIHLHFASHPCLAANFVRACSRR
jgi:cobyrinic acid a,c-diamide synthase